MTNVTHAKKFQVKQIDVVAQQTVSIKAEKNTAYQLFNDKKQRIKPSKVVKKGKDLLIYTEDTQELSVILVDYYQHTMITDQVQLNQLDATFAITGDSSAVAYVPYNSGLGWQIGLGLLGVAGTSVAIASKRDSDKEKNKAGQAEADKLKAEQDKAKAEADKLKAEQDKAKAEADKAKAEQDKAQAEADKLKAEQDKAKAEADKAKAEQDKAQAEADKLKAEQDKAKAEADKAKAEQDKAQAEADKLKAEQDKAKAEADKVKAEQDKAQAEADKAKAEQDKAKAEADKVKAEQDKAQAEADKAKAEQDKAQAEADKVKAEQDKAQAEADKVKAEQDKAQAEADKVKAEQDKAQAEADKLKAEQDKAKAEADKAKAEQDKAQAEADKAKAEQDKAQAEADKAKAEQDKAQAEADKVKAEQDKAQAEADKAKAEQDKAQAEADKAKAEQDKAQAEADKVKAEQDKAQAEADKAKAEQDKAQAEADKVKAEQDKAQAEADKAKAEQDKAQAEADKAKAEQDKAQAEADKAKAEQDKAQAEADKAKAEQDKAQAEADKVKAEQDKAQAEADKAKAEQDKAQAEADKLKAEQDKAKAEADKVKAEQDKAQAEADKAKAEQDKAQAEADKLKAEQDKAKAEADKVKAEQDKAQAEADKAKAEQDKAQAEADKLKAEQDKAKAEADKVKAEQDKAQAEADKAKAEQDKAQAEADKLKAEQDKAKAEADKVKAEQDKAQAEADKAKAEQDKAQAEADKLKAEQDKAKAEADKVKAEQDKAQAEADKAKAEQDKARAEADKVKAEQDKAQAEADKAKAEQDKARAEADKVKAEQDKAQAEADKVKAEQDKAQAEADKAKAEQDKAQAEADKVKAEQDKAQAEADKAKAEQDKAQAEETLKAIQAEQEKYLQNNPPKIKFDDITQDNIINQTEANSPEVKISGSVSNLQKGDILTIKIGDTSHQVSVSQGDFSLNVDGSILRNKPVLLAEVMRNGEKVAEKTHSYKVDTEISTPVITFNSITDDNVINANESREKAIEVSGKVTHFNAGEQLMVKIGDADAKRVAIQDDGTFSFWVAGQTLAQKPTIQASLTTQDDAENTATTLATAEYTVDTAPPTPTSISLMSITGDNHINVTEKSQKVSILGMVSGTNASMHKGQSVSMTVNGKNITATVGDDLRFEFKVQGEDLIKHNGYKLEARLTENGNIISAEKSYTVAPDAIAKIHLNDVNLGLAEEIGSVRLSGKLDFSNTELFKQGQNENFVRAIKLNIGEQSFNVGVKQDEHTFFLDLTHQQYQALKGQKISYELYAYNDAERWQNVLPTVSDIVLSNGRTQINLNDIKSDNVQADLRKVGVVFDDDNIKNTQTLQLDSESKTVVSGRVEGATVGNEILVQVGNKNYSTVVENDLSFNVKVENTDLDSTSSIQATLKVIDAQGKHVHVVDMTTVTKAVDAINSSFVNPHEYIAPENRVTKHSDNGYNFPYFIDALDADNRLGVSDREKRPFGGHGDTSVVKYYFANHEKDYNNADYISTLRLVRLNRIVPDSFEDFSPELKQEIRKAYETYESITNIKFQEVTSREEADTILYTAKFRPNADGGESSGNALLSGRDMWLNTTYRDINEFKKHINFHELLHTLGATHTDADLEDKFNIMPYADAEKTSEVTSMSYNDNFVRNSGRNNLSLYDLAYLHYRFGVNKDRNTGDDVYRFNQYNPMSSDGNIYIWDAAGVDTFDASKESEGVNVNLTPGSWIYRGEKSDTFLIKDSITTSYNVNNFTQYFTESPNAQLATFPFSVKRSTYVEGQAFIGYGTQIENLIGSNHADVLKGNKADNNIFGGDGNDQIWGDAGNDYLDGGKGVDTLHGGDGNDIFVVDNTADQVIETNTSDIDSIYAHVDYTLSNNIENLYLFGHAINGTGNQLNNTLQGNDLNNTLSGGAGDDRINGGRGSDTLTGGLGQDVFIFNDILDGSVDTITDFNVAEDKIALALKIFDSLTAQNIKNHMKYDADTGHLSYDADASGQVDAIHFATLNKGLDETKIIYEII